MREIVEQGRIAELGFVEAGDEERPDRHAGAVRLRRPAQGRGQPARAYLACPLSGRDFHASPLVRVFVFACASSRPLLRRVRRRLRRRYRDCGKARCSTSRRTPKTGKIIATFPKPDPDGVSARYIYLTQLETGLGSAPHGLDSAPRAIHAFWCSAGSARRSPRRSKKQVRRVERHPDEQRRRCAASRPRPCGWATWSRICRTARTRSISPVSSPATISAFRA